MRIICFLRSTGLSINSIGELLSEENPGSVISILLEQQEQAIRNELKEQQEKLTKLENIRKELRTIEDFSIESIGDIAFAVESKKDTQRFHAFLLILGIPMEAIFLTTIALWIAAGIWWPFAAYAAASVPFAFWISWLYFNRTANICPRCHEVFKPDLKEALWARHTPRLRKVTCTHCGYHGFCVEIYRKKETDSG